MISHFSCLLCRTRESLASNTSSIVESNRRQNPALSPGHIGTSSIGLPFSFRAIPEPPTTQPEKLQKTSNCLASITSVWRAPQTETVKVMEEWGREAFPPFWPSLFSTNILINTRAYTHTDTQMFRLLRIHLLGLLWKQAWLQETVPTASRTLLQKKEKLQNIKITVGETTYLKILLSILSRFLTIGIGK